MISIDHKSIIGRSFSMGPEDIRSGVRYNYPLIEILRELKAFDPISGLELIVNVPSDLVQDLKKTEKATVSMFRLYGDKDGTKIEYDVVISPSDGIKVYKGRDYSTTVDQEIKKPLIGIFINSIKTTKQGIKVQRELSSEQIEELNTQIKKYLTENQRYRQVRAQDPFQSIYCPN